MARRGRFISFEGGEGVGKSTQARLLARTLEDAGQRVVLTREPGGSAGGEIIRTLLLAGADERWSARSEALLFAAARADHVTTLILPALERGDWVVCDRFVDSSRAYQGLALGLGDQAILALHQFGSMGLLPDRTIVLELPEPEARRRLAERDGEGADRIGARPPAFHEKVRAAFRTLASKEPDRIRLVHAAGDPAEVAAAVRAQLRSWWPT